MVMFMYAATPVLQYHTITTSMSVSQGVVAPVIEGQCLLYLKTKLWKLPIGS